MCQTLSASTSSKCLQQVNGKLKIQCKITANQFCLELARVQVFGSQLYVIKMQFIILCKVVVLSVTETDVLMH